jgi:hypothetical protein
VWRIRGSLLQPDRRRLSKKLLGAIQALMRPRPEVHEHTESGAERAELDQQALSLQSKT